MVNSNIWRKNISLTGYNGLGVKYFLVTIGGFYIFSKFPYLLDLFFLFLPTYLLFKVYSNNKKNLAQIKTEKISKSWLFYRHVEINKFGRKNLIYAGNISLVLSISYFIAVLWILVYNIALAVFIAEVMFRAMLAMIAIFIFLILIFICINCIINRLYLKENKRILETQYSDSCTLAVILLSFFFSLAWIWFVWFFGIKYGLPIGEMSGLKCFV